MKSSNRSKSTEVNASSMADIAFLLLIFFLVTTTIFNDQGILTKLPPYEDEPILQSINEENVLTVRLNGKNELLVEGEPLQIPQLRKATKNFIMNPEGREDLPDKPTKAIVSLHHDRSTKFAYYLSVYNELKGAYSELWDEMAQKHYQKGFEELGKPEQKKIRAAIPLVISEAEPTDHFAAAN